MSKIEIYRLELQKLDNWDPYLLENSGLPGRRGNIELGHAVALEGDYELFDRYRTYDNQKAPTNSPYEFLAFCGVLGYGRLIASGDLFLLPELRQSANDPRWRIREAVAMALQMLGEKDMDVLLDEMGIWCKGNFLEQRAAATGLCEPNLLIDPTYAEKVINILDEITSSIEQLDDRRSEDFRTLRKGLGYCWSVAVTARPDLGKLRFEKWINNDDRDIKWIMRENLKKKRLQRMDEAWVITCQQKVN